MTDEMLHEMEEMIEDGHGVAECDNCGETMDVEPDADFVCPFCHGGRVTSVLVAQGLI